MSFSYHLLVAISEQGRRVNNEDSILPEKPLLNQKFFIVCDGVGGSEKGEVASNLASEALNYYLNKKPKPFYQREERYLKKGLQFVEEHFNEYIELHKESKGMATTIACLKCSPNSVSGFWVGDSRIYHIRKEEILFQSKDHSLLQRVIEQEGADSNYAKNFKFKNYILRAVKGSKEPAKADYFNRSNIEKGDYFLLLTDGILEAFSNQELVELVNKESNMHKLILNKCQLQSKDNFSIQIIKVD